MRKRRRRVSWGPVDEQEFVLPPDPREGSTVAQRYRIVRLLGEGGMGAVYEGEHIRIKRKVAIKFLHREHARTPAALTRFRREALAATATGNPHVVEVLDLDQAEDGTPFMVLEFLQGSSLAEDVERHGPMELGRALAIMQQLCEALDAVHDKGITHRDIKPDNLFLITRDGRPDFVKILDFGISKFTSSQDGVTVNLTRTGAAVGSIFFMAPEQTRGRDDVDRRADIYALGGVLFYLLTGRPVFEGDSIPYLMMQIVSDPPPRISLFRGDVPAHVQDALSCALCKDREQRFPDCASLWRALQSPSARHSAEALARTAIADSTPDARTHHASMATFDPVPRPPWRSPVAPLALLLVLAVAGWSLLRSTPLRAPRDVQSPAQARLEPVKSAAQAAPLPVPAVTPAAAAPAEPALGPAPPAKPPRKRRASVAAAPSELPSEPPSLGPAPSEPAVVAAPQPAAQPPTPDERMKLKLVRP
jgi:serine/threonine protein kinase